MADVRITKGGAVRLDIPSTATGTVKNCSAAPITIHRDGESFALQPGGEATYEPGKMTILPPGDA